MRFKAYGRFTYTDTPRKRAALLRKQRIEREALPLFADQIAAEQPGVDDVMATRAARNAKQQAETRSRRAADWWRARNRLASYPFPVREALRAYWQRCGWPGDPGYLLSMMHMYDTGRLDSVRPCSDLPTG